MLKTMYVDNTLEDQLPDNSIQILQQLAADCITTDLSITDGASVTHIGTLFNQHIHFSYLHNKKFHKIRNPSDLGEAFDTAHNTSSRLELYISLTTLWFDKTDPYFDITDWNQITVSKPVNFAYRPGKDPNANNPNAAIGQLTNQISTFVALSTKTGGATASTFNFGSMCKSSQDKYNDNLDIEKIFTKTKMDRKLEDPNNTGVYDHV